MGTPSTAGPGRRLDVDTTALLAAGRALAAAGRAAHAARPVAARATDGAGWAVDGTLPPALRRFAATLDVALARLVDDACEAAALLALASSRYEAAERSADARVAWRTGHGVAWRDAPGRPGG